MNAEEEISAIKKAVEEGTRAALESAFIKLGIDITDPIEVQKDFAFAREQRLAREQVTTIARRILLGVLLTGFFSTLLLGLKDVLK